MASFARMKPEEVLAETEKAVDPECVFAFRSFVVHVCFSRVNDVFDGGCLDDCLSIADACIACACLFFLIVRIA